jgi:hypothetical protein
LTREIEVTGVEDARRRLTSMGDRAVNARPALEDVADAIYSANADLWRSDDFGAWGAQKEADRGNPAVMRESGRLEAGLTRRGADSSTLDVSDDELFVGIPQGFSPLSYGRFHALGQGVPRRPITATAKTVQPVAMKTLRDWIVEG